MANRMITDVFFDLDHTLWDFDRNSRLAFARVFKKHKIDIDVETFMQTYEPINISYWKQYRINAITQEELRRGRLLDSFQRFDLSMPVHKIVLMANSYIEELPGNNYLFGNTRNVLAYLSQKYSLHIITNGFEDVQYLKLKNSGIHGYFKTVTTSEEAGAKKPHVDIFNIALSKAAIAPKCGVMIGDNMEADIQGARNAGMQTLFFNYRNEVVEAPCPSVVNLLELKNHL